MQTRGWRHTTPVSDGVPIRRVAAVRDVATGTPLAFARRCAIPDLLFAAEPAGEVVVDVPPDLVDDMATVIEVELRA